MAKIGVMGGTFDPIHVGHLMLAEYARTEMGLDQVWLLPTGCSYMKKENHVSSGIDRLAMVELAVRGMTEVISFSDMEVRREGYTYTYETVEQLNSLYPQHEFYLIFGADCLYEFEKWRYPERIFRGATILVAMRNDADKLAMEQKRQELVQKYNARICFLPFYRLEISSSQIRERIHKGKSIRFMVPDQVIHYIEEKGLYRDEDIRA